MQQELRLNIIPFTAPIQEAEFSFYQERIPNSYPVFKNDLNGLLTFHFSDAEIEKLERLYTDFQPPKEGALVLNINLTENPRFANHYFRYLIRQYFTGVADIMHQNFTSETEVWFLDSEIKNDKFSVYNQFTLKVQHGRVTDKHELVVSYDGTTKVLKKPVSQIYNFKTELFNWIAFNG
ncbi:MAG TPA: hypothetical protein DCQ50_10985, partial [Chryseobacterium sp.]|nr:hypothetical protein [Chryseobacterium sp.]